MTKPKKTSVSLSPAAVEALAFMKRYPHDFNLSHAVSRMLVLRAIGGGWKPKEKKQ